MTTTSLPHDSAVTPVTPSHLPCFATPPDCEISYHTQNDVTTPIREKNCSLTRENLRPAQENIFSINARKTALSTAFLRITKLFYIRFRARDSVTGVTAKFTIRGPSGGWRRRAAACR